MRRALILATALFAAACASPREEASRDLKTPVDQYPFQVVRAPDDTSLAVHVGGVSANQAAAVADLARRWRQTGGDAILVRVPAGGVQEADASAMAGQVRSILIAEGAPAERIRLERYDASADASAPIAVHFERYAANIPECGLAWDNLTGTQSNSVPSTFGCSVSANMAAQVANPRDLVQARAEDPVEASRLGVQTGQYRAGQPTGSSQPVEGGTVSTAVQ